MADLLLKDVSEDDILLLADAALKAGRVGVAEALYRRLIGERPVLPQLRARLEMCLHPGANTLPMLDALQALERIEPTSVFVGEGLATWLKLPPFMDNARFL